MLIQTRSTGAPHFFAGCALKIRLGDMLKFSNQPPSSYQSAIVDIFVQLCTSTACIFIECNTGGASCNRLSSVSHHQRTLTLPICRSIYKYTMLLSMLRLHQETPDKYLHCGTQGWSRFVPEKRVQNAAWHPFWTCVQVTLIPNSATLVALLHSL